MYQGLRKFGWVSIGVGLAFACGGNADETPANGSVTATVDPNGTTIESPAGARLVVPANGVSAPISVTVANVAAADIAALLPSGVAYAGQPTAFTPYATTFSVPVTITIPATSDANVVYSLDDASSREWHEVTGVEFAPSRATFKTSHFALFAACRRLTSQGSGGTSSVGMGGASALKTGGTSSFGGNSATSVGGATSVAQGGSIATGGTQAKGGSSGSGGLQITGGKGGTSGAPGNGGTTATGGGIATGGKTGTGGAGTGGNATGGTSATAGAAGRATAGASGNAGTATVAGAAGTAGTAGTTGATCALSDVMTSCQICLAQKCCTQQAACRVNDTCATFYNCYSGTTPKSYATCTAGIIEIPTSVVSLNQCATSNCISQCSLTAG